MIPTDELNYALVLDCYLSEQIDEADWQDRIASDPALQQYVADYYEYVRREAH